MVKTKRFIISNFVRNYLLIFLPFFLIVSLVFLVRISVLSSKISLDFYELFQLYSYFLPEIIFFTIPLSFIASVVNTFSKLSEDNELIALFALGVRPSKVLLFLLPSALLLSAILLVVSIMIYPQMKQKLSLFKQQKIAQATLNIEPKKLSQSFGNFHIYVDEKTPKGYKSVVLFNNQKGGNYQLFIAKRGVVENNGTVFVLRLFDGTGESAKKDKMEVLRYRELNLYQYASKGFKGVKSLSQYWAKALIDKGRMGRLLYLIFISISPLLIFAIAASLSIYNPRYQKNIGFLVIFILALLVYVPGVILQKSGNIYIFIAFILIFAILNGWIIKNRLLRRY